MANKPGINIVVLVERRFKGEQTKNFVSTTRHLFRVRGAKRTPTG